MGNDYIENDLSSPTTKEIKYARPLAMVLSQDVLNHAALITATRCAAPRSRRLAVPSVRDDPGHKRLYHEKIVGTVAHRKDELILGRGQRVHVCSMLTLCHRLLSSLLALVLAD